MQHVDVNLLEQIKDLDTVIQQIEDLDVHAKKIMSHIHEIASTVFTINTQKHNKNGSVPPRAATSFTEQQLATIDFGRKLSFSDSHDDLKSPRALGLLLQGTSSLPFSHLPHVPIQSASPEISPRVSFSKKASNMPNQQQVGSPRFVAPSSPPLRLAAFGGARAAPPAKEKGFDVIDYVNGLTLSSTPDSASITKHTATIEQPALLSDDAKAEFRRYLDEMSVSEKTQSTPVSARETSYAADSFVSESRREDSFYGDAAYVLNDELGLDFWPSKRDRNDHMKVHVYNGCRLFQDDLDNEIIEWSNMYDKQEKKGSVSEANLTQLKDKLDAGAYPDVRDRNNATLLLRAVQNGEYDDFQLAKLLLCYCVDVQAADIHKNTPLSFFSNETTAKLNEGGKACARQLFAQFAYMSDFKKTQFDLIKKRNSPNVIHKVMFESYSTQLNVLMDSPFFNRNDIRDLAIAQIFQWGFVNREISDTDHQWLYKAIKARNAYAVEILLQHADTFAILDATKKWIDDALELVLMFVPAGDVKEKMTALLNLKKNK